MAQQLNIVDCKDAILALLSATLPVSYGQPVDVREIGGKDFDENGQLVLKKVAVRVRFGQAAYADARDISLTTLSASLYYQVVCRHESLRSNTEARDRSLALTAVVMDQLAGARLQLPDGTKAVPIAIRSVLQAMDGLGPVEDCYAITIEISGTAQFSGVNA